VFSEGYVEAGGVRLRYLEAGQGTPLVHLHGGGGLPFTRAHELLSRQFRVIAFDMPESSARELASTMAQAIKNLGIDSFNLMGTSLGSETALWLAIQEPASVLALVLEAPTAIRPGGDADLERRLRDLATPTLALFGTTDTVVPPDMGRLYKERMPNAHLVFVYDAGHAIGADRPEAFAEVVGDFLERHEAFIISRTATVIHP
jgi:pimeloyl-ACP methyl ester carboxylesterase